MHTNASSLSAPQLGVRVVASLPYCDHVTLITTPFDHFMADVVVWLDSAWYLWAAAAILVAGVVAIVAVSKSRARARSRVPQYRRHVRS